ncbi:hypothetical protein M409DRAFT_26030 [Zasmidium cellare ATCC 36951]|uniref:SMODS and SLOG-associating 2TM effector domain-containing protein n=1 Tax=Zasmidium cellare ATCC 36951 TaxID=1080233 RepID=A0A6A6C8D9_ZASCE|nr:uncharacterized protein M409DRAFT_26030 [Zasmidium cellare ATCC 36951]KAF2163414.1 hypothetical protein M409DRAFT_26030 [Zasmidium cellare ATCC 36951]
MSTSEADERASLLQFPGSYGAQDEESLPDAYKQFCLLMGNRPIDHPADQDFYPPKDTLYHRALHHRKNQGRIHAFSSAFTNTLLLAQIVLGATLTGLGASDQSRALITTFGALNTIIAGLVAFLKSRGQPMRARMFRDDLDRVVDEIENSAIMWRGISQKAHGYDAIDTDESVTVRSEVARLTRLYDRAVKTNTMNDPDFYGTGITQDPHNAGLRSRTGQTLLPTMPPNLPAGSGPSGAATGPAPAIPDAAADPDESPATKAPEAKKDDDIAKDAGAGASQPADGKGKQPEEAKPVVDTPAPAPVDLDESPATTAAPAKAKDDSAPGNGAGNGDDSKKA